MNDKIDEKQKQEQEIEWRKKYFRRLFLQTQGNLEKLQEKTAGNTPDKESIDSMLALQIPFLGAEIAKQLREDADKVYGFLTATHHASTLKSVGSGFAGASVALHGLDFLRIPAIYLASFIMGRKVPFTLKNNAKWLYAASLLGLSIAALAVPAVAPFIGLAAVSLAVSVGAFTVARHFYRKRQIKKELAEKEAEIKKTKNELEDLKDSKVKVEDALDSAIAKAAKQEDKKKLEAVKTDVNEKNAEIKEAEENLSKAKSKQPAPKMGLPSLTRYILGPSKEEKAAIEEVKQAEVVLENLRAERRKLFAAIPGKEQLILAENFQARFDKAQTQDELDAIFEEMEGFNQELQAKTKHLQSLHDSVAELKAEDKAMGAMAVVDKGVGTILGAVVLGGMVTSLFFPPIGAAILLGAAAVASTYLVGRLATPLFKKLGSWVSSKLKPAEKAEAGEKQAEEKLEQTPVAGPSNKGKNQAAIMVALAKGDMLEARKLTLSLLQSDRERDALDTQLTGLVNTQNLSGIKGFFDGLALGIEDNKITEEGVKLLFDNDVYVKALPLLQQALEGVTDEKHIPQALLQNNSLTGFLEETAKANHLNLNWTKFKLNQSTGKYELGKSTEEDDDREKEGHSETERTSRVTF